MNVCQAKPSTPASPVHSAQNCPLHQVLGLSALHCHAKHELGWLEASLPWLPKGEKPGSCLLMARGAREDGLAVTGVSACGGMVRLGDLQAAVMCLPGLLSASHPPFKQGLGQPHWGVDTAWNSRAKEAGRSLPSISVTDKDTEARRGSGCVVRTRWGPRPTMMLLWLPGPHPE